MSAASSLSPLLLIVLLSPQAEERWLRYVPESFLIHVCRAGFEQHILKASFGHASQVVHEKPSSHTCLASKYFLCIQFMS